MTANPSRAIGSHSRPPPQPMSSRLSPSNGARAFGIAAEPGQGLLADEAQPAGLNRCSGANLPFGSHHSAAMAENRSTSSASMLEAAVSVIAA